VHYKFGTPGRLFQSQIAGEHVLEEPKKLFKVELDEPKQQLLARAPFEAASRRATTSPGKQNGVAESPITQSTPSSATIPSGSQSASDEASEVREFTAGHIRICQGCAHPVKAVTKKPEPTKELFSPGTTTRKR
jgi:hypothetical protein